MPYETIERLEFELSSICNCYCIGCHRHVQENDKVTFNPSLKLNQVLDPDIIKNVLSDRRVSKQVQISFVGTFGEAISHPNFLDILDIIYGYRPRASVRINTNGSLRTQAFFSALAKSLSRFKYYEMMFAVDGLEDTNHIYRRGAIWSKIMANMDSFLEAGGRADWQFIEFSWNKHQIEDIKKLAESKGMKFWHRHNGVPTVEKNIQHPTVNEPGSFIEARIEVDREGMEIRDDECISMNQLHINAQGEVHPCCLFNAATYSPNKSAMREMDEFMYSQSRTWMNLNYHTFTDIMNNVWWTFLHSTFEGNDDTCNLCISKCGKKKSA